RRRTQLAEIYNGMEATWKWTELTVVGLYKMIVGDISSKNIGGPLTIAKISGEAAAQGPANVIFLIALLSINLGVLNLLPIPILDGGHLLFFLIEGILRKPLGERQRELAQQVGLVLLVGVMIFAFWNALDRIFFSLSRFMRTSQLLLPTLREDPGKAETVSHRLMLRAGLIRKVAAGLYSYLPLGLRIIRKVEQIVREEMNRAGAQELLMPIASPAELWQETGRWNFYGKELLRFKDRHERDFCL